MAKELTEAQVAAMFGVDQATVLRWEREGMLPKRHGQDGKWRLADIETVRGKRRSLPGVY